MSSVLDKITHIMADLMLDKEWVDPVLNEMGNVTMP